jgi:hypothetical protein
MQHRLSLHGRAFSFSDLDLQIKIKNELEAMATLRKPLYVLKSTMQVGGPLLHFLEDPLIVSCSFPFAMVVLPRVALFPSLVSLLLESVPRNKTVKQVAWSLAELATYLNAHSLSDPVASYALQCARLTYQIRCR